MTTSMTIPIELLDQHLIALGKTGAGKSYALRDLIELLLDNKRRVCIIDPKGDHWGIRSSPNGKKAGYPVVLFGDFKEELADVIPINSRVGKEIAELVATGNRPCVIGFRGWMPNDRTKFWIDFASTLFNLNKSPLWLPIDEVHNFCPKGKILDPEVGKSIHWTNRLASEGRGYGIRLLMASQRPQKVHNDTLTSAETLVAMRVIHAADRTAVKEWIDGCGDPERGKIVINSLAGMKRGEAYVWSPEINFFERLTFPKIKTFDSYKAPEEGKHEYIQGWAQVNLEEVKKKLARVIEEAKENDPAELKKRIRELERERRSIPSGKIDEGVVKRAAIRAKEEAVREYSQHIKKLETLIRKQQSSMKHAAEMLIDVGVELPKIVIPEPKLSESATITHHQPVPISSIREQRQPMSARNAGQYGDSDVKLIRGEKLMLAAVVKWRETGITSTMMRVQAGIKHKETLRQYTVRLKGAGFIEQVGNLYYPTDQGISFNGGAPEPPRDTQEVMAMWMHHFNAGARRMLQYLVDEGGEFRTSEDVMTAANIQHPETYRQYKVELKSTALIIEQDGMIAANKETFFL